MLVAGMYGIRIDTGHQLVTDQHLQAHNALIHSLHNSNPINPPVWNKTSNPWIATLPEEFIPWHALTYHSNTWSCPSSFLYTTYINLSLMHVFTTSADLPDILPMFQVANLMQSGTLEVFFRPPTGFPAGHQVYDRHNDGNCILQFGQVPHRSVSRRQMALPTRYYGLYPPIVVDNHIKLKN